MNKSEAMQALNMMHEAIRRLEEALEVQADEGDTSVNTGTLGSI